MASPVPFDPTLRAELYELTSSLCKALNDSKRLMVLYALGNGPMSVNELGASLGVGQANISQHLAVLRERGLVDTERKGNSIIYSLRYPQLLEAIDLLRAVMAKEYERRQTLLVT